MTHRKCNYSCLLAILLAGLVSEANAQHPIKFDVRLLTIDANEGCDVADVDGDGKLDVIAGRNWYHNDDWTPRPVRLIEDRNGYARSNGEWALDVNEDGRPDVISMDFFEGTVKWFENPGAETLALGGLWPEHVLADTGYLTNEASFLVDVTGDGKVDWITNQWNKTNPVVIWSFTQEQREVPVGVGGGKTATQMVPALVGHNIGPLNGHGIGFGDINNDGRGDILVGMGWYECPEGDRLNAPWKYHADWELHAACPMLVYDLDGDGINDLITSNAHDYGLFWWRGLGNDDQGKPQFEEHLIDKSFSQAHCLHLADLDGDGTLELVTGKRVRAHNGKDPGGTEPPEVRYYVWNQDRKTYEPHIIDRGHVGIGLQIRTADLDADGDLDIVLAGKEGTQILFSQLK
jgi:hypothetical protein